MSECILIVEDEEHTAGILADYLCRDGYTPICLVHGTKVVSCVRERMPALILLDLRNAARCQHAPVNSIALSGRGGPLIEFQKACG